MKISIEDIIKLLRQADLEGRQELADCVGEILKLVEEHGIKPPQWPDGILGCDETLEVLKRHNKWRRGADVQETDPKTLGLALDAVISYVDASTGKLQ